MTIGLSHCYRWFGSAVLAGMLMLPSGVSAIAINGLERDAFEHIYGSYAHGGDCSREPVVMLHEGGMTFRANGRTVEAARVEYAASFFGMHYDGNALVFFPFPRSSSDLGAVLMFVNENETPGEIRIEATPEPGRPMDPFQASLAGDYLLCAGTGSGVAPPAEVPPQQVQGVPADWSNLPSLVGRYPGSYAADNIDLFDKGDIASALRAALGDRMEILKANLSVVGPLERTGNYYYVMGNAQHRGGEDQAYILIDAARRAVQIGLWERGKLKVYSPGNGRLSVPPAIQMMLNSSPDETAHAIPGPPWELLPVQGRAPVAYVEPAASPSITSLTLYCENGRPYMAMLLGKSATGSQATVAWNFAGRLVNIPVQRANSEGTYWVGGLTGTSLLQHLMTQADMVYLRINGQHEGEASLAGAPAVLRTSMRPCAQL